MDEKGDHIQMANTPGGAYVMFCLHCGERWIPTLPIPVSEFSNKCKLFIIAHKGCQKGEREFTVEQMVAV